jgi:putative CocE/NonD family hydrolase
MKIGKLERYSRKDCRLLLLTLVGLMMVPLYAQTSVEISDNGVLVEKNIMVPMRDGVRLATDIYRLRDTMPSPVLIARTPYDKNLLWRDDLTSDRRIDDAKRFVDAGYTVVVQDVRGRYASEGDFNPHVNETNDGVDMFAWVAAQPWSNGILGTFGGSYPGGTQWLPARENPPALKAMVPEVTFSDMYEGNTHPGGVKVLHDLRWTVGMIPDVIRRRQAAGENIPANEELPSVNTVLNELPLAGHPMIKKYGSFYHEWLNHPTAGAYWDSISPSAGYGNITVPALNISGWYDIFIWGTLQNYRGMKDRGGSETARNNQKLIIGPWTHGNFSGRFQERYYGGESSSDAMDLTGIKLRWYDHWLKGIENGIDKEDPVMIFVMGVDKWRTEKDWPIPDTKYRNYYLHSAGKANTLNGDGDLSLDIPRNEPSDVYTYDPMNPVPTVGGQVILPGENAMGPRDQQEVEKREDVLVYSTPVLEKAVEVTGNIELKLFVSSSALDTDFSAKLVDVYPDGRAMILTGGILRARYHKSFEKGELLEQGKVYELDINLLATSNVFLPGHRIRLEVSSSNFPQFNRNSNTGGHIPDETAEQYRPATNRIYHEEAYPSHLILPIIER